MSEFTPPTIQQQVAYQQAAATRMASSKCLISAFDKLGVPESMVDIGCGPGHLVQIADALGVWAVGIDISLPEEHILMPNQSHLFQADITGVLESRKLKLNSPFEMTICWEVAEHIEPYFSEPLCDLLSDITSGTLLFTAATPGQGGSGHVNERPHKYWIDQLESRGFTYIWPVTEALRGEWSQLAPNAWWYGRNVMCFRKGQ